MRIEKMKKATAPRRMVKNTKSGAKTANIRVRSSEAKPLLDTGVYRPVLAVVYREEGEGEIGLMTPGDAVLLPDTERYFTLCDHPTHPIVSRSLTDKFAHLANTGPRVKEYFDAKKVRVMSSSGRGRHSPSQCVVSAAGLQHFFDLVAAPHSKAFELEQQPELLTFLKSAHRMLLGEEVPTPTLGWCEATRKLVTVKGVSLRDRLFIGARAETHVHIEPTQTPDVHANVHEPPNPVDETPTQTPNVQESTETPAPTNTTKTPFPQWMFDRVHNSELDPNFGCIDHDRHAAPTPLPETLDMMIDLDDLPPW